MRETRFFPRVRAPNRPSRQPAHSTLVGNTKDVQTVRRIVSDVEARFGKSQRVWVMDRGMISEDTVEFLSEHVARPNAEQKRILQALAIDMPERLSPDRIL